MMKVRCTKIEDIDGKFIEYHPLITKDSIYLVIGIAARIDDKPLDYHIIDNEGVPSYWPAYLFEIVDGQIPSNWTATATEYSVYLVPKPWSAPGFLEKYFDDDPEAIEVFKSEVTEMNRQYQ